MKQMSCQQLGGPCEFTHEGETADEIIKSQDAHLKEMVASGDAVQRASIGWVRVRNVGMSRWAL